MVSSYLTQAGKRTKKLPLILTFLIHYLRKFTVHSQSFDPGPVEIGLQDQTFELRVW